MHANAQGAVAWASSVASYLNALVATCATTCCEPASVIVFGSAARGGLPSKSSDVDTLIIVPDGTSENMQRALGQNIALLEAERGLRAPTSNRPTICEDLAENLTWNSRSAFICSESDLLSGDCARILKLHPLQALLVDRVVLATILDSAVTFWGKDLLARVNTPPIRRLDVLKASMSFFGMLLMSAILYPALPNSTQYAMGVLKRSLHSCFYVCHGRSASLEEEVCYFREHLRKTPALDDLTARRSRYSPSFRFVIAAFPQIMRLQVHALREGKFDCL
ncbi:MAG: nucleotidyltransferase domain-containing protein [Terracidiphilus sp.]